MSPSNPPKPSKKKGGTDANANPPPSPPPPPAAPSPPPPEPTPPAPEEAEAPSAAAPPPPSMAPPAAPSPAAPVVRKVVPGSATPPPRKPAPPPPVARPLPPPPEPEPAPAPSVGAKIAVVGIPASGKTTYFRYLSGHFGLNLPLVYIPSRGGKVIPLFGDIGNEVVMEETTYESDPNNPDAAMDTTTRMYVNRPMEDPTRLFIELAQGQEEQGILTKYPLPTKYNQFVEMKLNFRYGVAGNLAQAKPMVLRTVDEAGGIISDYFTYDRLWLSSPTEDVPMDKCRVIPRFDTWKGDRQELWRRGLTLMGRFTCDADGIILLLTPQLGSLRDSAQQVNLARGVFRYARQRNIPVVVAVSKADMLKDFYLEVEQVLTNRGYISPFDTYKFLTERDGSGLGSILAAQEGRGFVTREDAYLIASAISTGEGRPLLYGDTSEVDMNNGATAGVPVMVNTTLPLARICERVLTQRGELPTGS
jgi:hypothetical protein